jgi:hypothetical protein
VFLTLLVPGDFSCLPPTLKLRLRFCRRDILQVPVPDAVSDEVAAQFYVRTTVV